VGRTRGPPRARRRPGVGPAPRGWRGPSPPAGAPGGRRRLGAGAAQRPAVDGHRPPAGCGSATVPILVAVPVGQPGADGAGQHVGVQTRTCAADGGLGRDAAVAGAIAAGAERGPDRSGRVGGPLGDRGDRPRPASTAAAAGPRMQASGWRRPRAARGSGRRRGRPAGARLRGVELAGIGADELDERGWDPGMMGRQARASVRVMRQ
jgi:hypothetical protein